MNKRRIISSLILIAIVVVFVRYVMFLAYISPIDLDGRPPDPDRWWETARNIVDGHGYALSTFQMSDTPRPTALRGPSVVYFFAAVLWLFGDHLWAVFIAQWLIDVGTAFILFFIALDIFRDWRVGVTASLLFACYVPSLLLSFSVWSEPLYGLLLASFTLCFLRALNQPVAWRLILCGVFLGLTTLAKPVMQFYPLVVLPLLIWRLDWHWQKALYSFAVLVVAFAAVMSPWVVRNYGHFHAFIAGTNQTGKPLYQSNYALGRPDYLHMQTSKSSSLSLRQVLESRFGSAPDNPDLWSYASVKDINEFELDQMALQEAKKVILTFPGRYVILSAFRVLRLWFGQHVFQDMIHGYVQLTPLIIRVSSRTRMASGRMVWLIRF